MQNKKKKKEQKKLRPICSLLLSGQNLLHETLIIIGHQVDIFISYEWV